jgi:hypothetical protein
MDGLKNVRKDERKDERTEGRTAQKEGRKEGGVVGGGGSGGDKRMITRKEKGRKGGRKKRNVRAVAVIGLLVEHLFRVDPQLRHLSTKRVQLAALLDRLQNLRNQKKKRMRIVIRIVDSARTYEMIKQIQFC